METRPVTKMAISRLGIVISTSLIASRVRFFCLEELTANKNVDRNKSSLYSSLEYTIVDTVVDLPVLMQLSSGLLELDLVKTV